MLKFFRNTNIDADSNLLLSLPTLGYCASFVSDLLIKNNNFEYVGIFYSQYLNCSIGYHSNGQNQYNAEVYHNSSKKLILVNFLASVNPLYFQDFYKEFVDVFVTKYKVNSVTLLGSIDYANVVADKEVFNKNVDCFAVTNLQNDYLTKYKLRKFESMLTEPKKKDFDELKLIEGQGFIKKLLKQLKKSKLNYSYVFVYAKSSFDPYGGLGLYNKVCYMFGLSNQDLDVQRDLGSFSEFFKNISSSKLQFDQSWLLYLKE